MSKIENKSEVLIVGGKQVDEKFRALGINDIPSIPVYVVGVNYKLLCELPDGSAHVRRVIKLSDGSRMVKQIHRDAIITAEEFAE